VGHPIGHSLSPAIHNAALEACGIDARYRAVDVAPADLGDWVKNIRSSEALGFNVTVPHKEAVIPFLDEIGGDALRVGAVNTVVRSSSAADQVRLTGANTDTVGFRQSLAVEADTSLRDQRVVLLGAGGAARAIALVALQDGAAELIIANRHLERAERLLQDLDARGSATATRAVSLEDAALDHALESATIVVNATSVGLRSADLPLDPGPISVKSLVVDIVYNPPETAFLTAAARRGTRTLPGLGMLIYQAAAAFELWTGVPAPLSVMHEAGHKALQAIL
jgi:shikimate dehydrogenase